MANSIQFGRDDNGFDSITGVGTALSGGAALTGGVNHLTTASGQTAAVLPAYASGPVVVRTITATTGLVFPPTALGKINAGSAGASFSVAQDKTAIFFPHPNGIDYTAVLSA